ncbi:neurotrophin-4-like [Glandiceps talaboti]
MTTIAALFIVILCWAHIAFGVQLAKKMMKHLLGILVVLCVCSNTAETAPKNRRTQRNGDENIDDEVEIGEDVLGVPKIDFPNPAEISRSLPPDFASHLVTFSTEKPSAPPWPITAMPDADIFDDNTEITETFGRRKRRRIQKHPETAVCDSQSGWVTKQRAKDIYGQNVTVLARFRTHDNSTVGQYFYETTCQQTGETAPPNSCRGIDSHRYDSTCKEKKTWSRAMVRTSYGTYVWDWITVKTSCACALRRKQDPLIRTTRDALLYALLNKNWRN